MVKNSEFSKTQSKTLFTSKYSAFSSVKSARRLKRRGYYSRPTEKLPEHVANNLNTIQFGVASLPSDNMNKVMMGTF